MKKFLAGMLVAHAIHKIRSRELTAEEKQRVDETAKKIEKKVSAVLNTGIERLLYGKGGY
jgi:hypothetical protein